MGVLTIALYLLACVLVHLVASDSSCVKVDWKDDFNKDGLVKCDQSNYTYFLNGLHRGSGSGSKDKINDIDAGECCPVSADFSSNVNIDYAVWDDSFDLNNNWNECPDGFFLQGLYRGDNRDTLAAIREGRCGKPVDHPRRRSEFCYIEEVPWEAESEESLLCDADYFIVGLYRGSCSQLHCLDEVRCCKMTEPDPLNSLAKAKILSMDITQFDVAHLAHYLGFGWCFGCRAENVGEDFEQNGDDYIAKKDGRCVGANTKDNRLVIRYGDWNFVVRNMTYGDTSTETIGPETLTNHVFYNDKNETVDQSINQTVQIPRKVIHIPTSDWTITPGDNLKIRYSPDDQSGSFAVHEGYDFTYSNEENTVDVTGNTQISNLNVTEEFAVTPGSTQKYAINLYKTKVTRSYTLTAVLEYSVQLSGFLRGGQDNNPGTNYHVDYYKKTSHKDFTFKFGNNATSFQDDLKWKSTHTRRPWDWNLMYNELGAKAKNTVRRLTHKGKLEFTFTGTFEDIVADRTELVLEEEEWKEPVVG